MNKIDAFGVMGSLLLVWIFAVFLMPPKIMIVVYMGISAWAVGVFVGRLPMKLSKKTDKDYLDRMFKVADEQGRVLGELLSRAKEMTFMIKSQQATIDALMFEYCPEEMTKEQIASYEAHVRAVSQQQEDEVEFALNPANGRYEKMLAEAQELIALDPMPDTEEGKRLLSLTTQIKGYEKLHFPFTEVKH